MKKLLTICLIMATAFTVNAQNKTYYIFITDTEHDKSYDEDDNNGYVNLTTNIVSINCNLGKYAIERQYIAHYNAEQQTQNRSRAFIGASGITTAWIYNTYDEAFASRRDWLANKGNESKRIIKHFYITCN